MNISDRAIAHIHRQNALESVKGTQSLIISNNSYLYGDKNADLMRKTSEFSLVPVVFLRSTLLRTLHRFALNLVLRDSLPKYDRLTQLTEVNNHGGGGETRVAFQALL